MPGAAGSRLVERGFSFIIRGVDTHAGPTGPLVDTFGRTVRSLRLSVTDRCNLRCLYCMPGGRIEWFDRDHLLSFEEIRKVTRTLARLGVREVRLTGGEPLLRLDLPDLVRMLAAIDGIDDLALTTNGLLLGEMAAPLLEAGVRRFNVHLDSLDGETFERASRRSALGRVEAGLETLVRLGVAPVKVNVVLMRGINDHEVIEFAALARRRPFKVRFIELMPIGDGERFEADRLVPGREVRARIEAVWPLVSAGRERPAAPARIFRFADGVGGDIGFINPVTEPFCPSCDRIRLTADGMLRNCLFARSETDLRPLLRGGGDEGALETAVRATVAAKGPGGCLDLAPFYADRTARKMWQIGG
jgi:cyclic pyranopterin phosphate synthase